RRLQGERLSLREGYPVLSSPKELVQVDAIEALSKKDLQTLIRNIPLRGNHEVRPYEEAEISSYRVDPQSMGVAQNFVQDSKLLSLLQGLNGLYQGHVFPKLASRPPHIL